MKPTIIIRNNSIEMYSPGGFIDLSNIDETDTDRFGIFFDKEDQQTTREDE